jgi:NTP pyrophosphatase (non-canonical NTP hydrolase)
MTHDNPKLCEFRQRLIAEEFEELQKAIATHDFKEIRDALADLLYVVYGTAVAFGINADADFAIVHSSNMSKLCATEEEAQLTVADYATKYAAGLSPYANTNYTFDADSGKYIVRDTATGKILKNIHYTKVQW